MNQRRFEKKGPRHRAGRRPERRSIAIDSPVTVGRGQEFSARPAAPRGNILDLPNIRARAAALLSEVLKTRRNLKAALQTEQSKLEREDDRALLRELVAGVVRKLPHLDWAVSRKMSRGIEDTEEHLLNILRVGAYQILCLSKIPVYAAVHECVEAAKAYRDGAAGFVNGILRAVSEDSEGFPPALDAEIAKEGLGFRACFPEWMASRYTERFGEHEAERILMAFQRPPSTFIYFPGRELEQRGLEALEREGIGVAPDGIFERTYTISAGDVFRTSALREGYFYVMDPGSQVPARLLPLSDPPLTLDLCAAPGGKTVILSSRAPDGVVVGADAISRRTPWFWRDRSEP